MIGRGNVTPPAASRQLTGLATPNFTDIGSLPQTQSTAAAIPSTPSPAAQGGGGPTGRLFLLNKNNGMTEVITADIIGKQRKVIYTDKDSARKIQSISNVSANGSTLVMVLGNENDFAGQLVSLKTDGSGQTTVLADNIVATGSIALSPDQAKLALIRFANTEQDFGFTLSVQDLNGANKRDIAQDEQGIGHVAFSPDGKQVAFVAGATATAEAVKVVTLSTGTAETLYTTRGRTVQDFNWGRSGLLTLVTAATDDRTSQKTDVLLIDPKNTTSIRLAEDDATEHAAVSAPDAAGIAFIKVTTNKIQPGEVIMVLPDGKQPVNLGTATDILGWTP